MEKRGSSTERLIPWIIVVVIIILSFVAYGLFSGKLGAILQFFKDILKIGR